MALGLLAAGLSPLAVLAPNRFARLFALRAIIVPIWQIVLLLIYGLPSVVSELSYPGALLYMLPYLTAFVVIVGLLWLLASYMVRPLAAAWDETPRRSYWKGGLVLLAFVLPLPVVLGQAEDLLRRWLMEPVTGDNWREVEFYMRNVLSTAALTGVLYVEVFQMIRGLASLGGGPMPDLAPICRDCGYSLEGVVHLYEAGRPRDETDPAIPRVCPECGCQITISLDPAIRQGTAWSRGESYGIVAWRRTAGAVLWRPGEFFAHLPLASPRRAALWFWLGCMAATWAMVATVLAADFALCGRVKGLEPLLPTRAPSHLATHVDGRSVPPPAIPMVFWLLDCANWLGPFLLMILGLGTLLLTRAANGTARLMSRHRERSLHPAGLLLVAYLSPAVLTAGVLVLAAGVIARLIGGKWLPVAPQFARRFLGGPEGLAMIVWLAAAIPALGWCYLAAKRAAHGIRYANH